MNAPCHCSRETALRAVQNGAGWVLPAVMLALLPKCPLCLAAWLSLLSGIVVSSAAASALQIALITLCIVAIFVFFVRHVTLSLPNRHL